MQTSTLSFGDTFTLPITADRPWTIKDIRPSFAHLATEDRSLSTAVAKCDLSEEIAFYTPGEGWRVPRNERRYEDFESQLAELAVSLPQKSDEEIAASYRRMLGAEARTEVRDIISLVETWTTGTDIDALDLKAHVAATAALTAAGTPDNVALFTAVYNATLTALREVAAA